MSKNRSYFNNLKKYWFRSDARIFYADLGPKGHYSKLLYLYLGSVPEHIDPSEDKMAEYLGVSVNTVHKYLQPLVRHNIVTLSKGPSVRGRKGRNIYSFVPFEEWNVELTINIKDAFSGMRQAQVESSPPASREQGEDLPPHMVSRNHPMACGGTTSPSEDSPPHGVRDNNRSNRNEMNDEQKDSDHQSIISFSKEPENQEKSSVCSLVEDDAKKISEGLTSQSEINADEIVIQRYERLGYDDQIERWRKTIFSKNFILQSKGFLQQYLPAVESVFNSEHGLAPILPDDLAVVLNQSLDTRFSPDDRNPKFQRGGTLHEKMRAYVHEYAEEYRDRLRKSDWVAPNLSSLMADICDMTTFLGCFEAVLDKISVKYRRFFSAPFPRSQMGTVDELLLYILHFYSRPGDGAAKYLFWQYGLAEIERDLRDQFWQHILSSAPNLRPAPYPTFKDADAATEFYWRHELSCFGIGSLYWKWSELKDEESEVDYVERTQEDDLADIEAFLIHLESERSASTREELRESFDANMKELQRLCEMAA